MGLPWAGKTESNAVPNTYYSYSVSTSNRTFNSIHVTLTLSIRMRWYTNYYSFQIAHECTVNGVYSYTDLKLGRRFWGHQWTGSYYGPDDLFWQYGTYDYDGSAWHGPYVVFDGDVPIGVDDTNLHIIPCITQPPITGMGGDGIYAWNYQDVCNWAYQGGWWRPFGDDIQIGSYAWDFSYPWDGCWLNNRGLRELDNAWVGAYPRPSAVSGLSLSPSRIDVANQDSQRVGATWNNAQRADHYNCILSSDEAHNNTTFLVYVKDASYSFNPKTILKKQEMFDGDKIWVGVLSIDSSNVEALARTWAGPVTYFEVPSQAPNSGYIIGRKNVKNQILFRGEDSAKMYYSGQRNGSYHIAKLQLYRESDGKTVEWTPSEATSSLGMTLRMLTIPGIDRPQEERVWELRAYNTKGRPVYVGGNQANGWLKINITYYGGVIYVFDGTSWHEGICWVYDTDNNWYESDAVWVNTNGSSDWETL